MRKIAYICCLTLCLAPRGVQAQAADAEKLIDLINERIRADQRELCIRRAMDHTKPLDLDEWRDEPTRTERQPRVIVKDVRLPFGNIPIFGGKEVYAGFIVRF